METLKHSVGLLVGLVLVAAMTPLMGIEGTSVLPGVLAALGVYMVGASGKRLIGRE